jgi:hypothetical protein
VGGVNLWGDGGAGNKKKAVSGLSFSKSEIRSHVCPFLVALIGFWAKLSVKKRNVVNV